MIKYDRIGISEETDVNKTNASKECDTCLYWYFLDKGLNITYIFAMVVII